MILLLFDVIFFNTKNWAKYSSWKIRYVMYCPKKLVTFPLTNKNSKGKNVKY